MLGSGSGITRIFPELKAKLSTALKKEWLDKTGKSDGEGASNHLTADEFDTLFDDAVDVVFQADVPGYEKGNRVLRNQVKVTIKVALENALRPLEIYPHFFLQGKAAQLVGEYGYNPKGYNPVVSACNVK